MPEYVWKARSPAGNIVKDEMNEVNESVVVTKLRKMNYTDIKVKKKPKDLFENIEIFQPKVSTKDVVIFTRQFATMIDAGLPLVQCLEILSSQQENKTFKKVLAAVKSSVEGGSTFADALKNHPKVFDDLFVNLVHAGETGGILDTILRRLASFLEKAEALKRKVKGAMIYPAVVITIAVSVVVILLVFVIPVFKEMFEGAGEKLPGPTLLVMSMSDLSAKLHYPHDRNIGHHRFRFSKILPHRKRQVDGRQLSAQESSIWPTPEKGSGGPLLFHSGHHDFEWCSDTGRPGDHCQDRGKCSY